MGYNRVNIDGKSITESRKAAAELKAGSLVVIDGNGKFANATAGHTGRMYAVNTSHVHMSINEPIAKDTTIVGEYVEQGRELALLVGAGTYTKDAAVGVAANGKVALSPDEGEVIGYCQDDVTLAADGHVRIRIMVG